MAHQIEKKDGFFEVHVSGPTSKSEILEIILELDRLDRGKTLPDLWIVSGESQVPFQQFGEIARSVQTILPRGAIGNKTAIVAADAFHKAQIDLFRTEASFLPFEIRVFQSRDEAVAWIKAPGGSATLSAPPPGRP